MAVATQAALAAEQKLLVWLADDWPVAIFKVGGKLYAVDARCTHQDAWLHEGTVEPRTCEVTCPVHGARFNLKTGYATHGPAAAPLTIYVIHIDLDGTLWIQTATPWWRSG